LPKSRNVQLLTQPFDASAPFPMEDQSMVDIVIRRREPEQWVPVWWYRLTYGTRERVKAIAGNPSKTGKTVHIRANFKQGGMVDRHVNPKNLEPRSTDSGDEKP
jgi:hypothetical protein